MFNIEFFGGFFIQPSTAWYTVDPFLSEYFIHPGLLASVSAVLDYPLLPSPSQFVIITRLILSNLSSVLANQFLRCVLFHHLLSCDSIIFSLTLTLCSYPIFPIFLHFYLVVLSLAMALGSTLTHPSARAQTNQSRVVLFHKDQKQLVSSHISRFFLVCLCCPICAPSHTSIHSSQWMLAWLFHTIKDELLLVCMT